MADFTDGNKYIPQDFDPNDFRKYKSKYIRIKKSNERPRRLRAAALSIRMLWPFTVSCEKCGEIMFVGTKFNARVKKLKRDTYLGFPIWSIEGKCFECSNPIMLFTDPENVDYVVKYGGKRLFDRKIAEKKYEEELEKFKSAQENLDIKDAIIYKAINSQNELYSQIQINRLIGLTNETKNITKKILYNEDDDHKNLFKNRLKSIKKCNTEIDITVPKFNNKQEIHKFDKVVNFVDPILGNYESSNDSS